MPNRLNKTNLSRAARKLAAITDLTYQQALSLLRNAKKVPDLNDADAVAAFVATAAHAKTANAALDPVIVRIIAALRQVDDVDLVGFFADSEGRDCLSVNVEGRNFGFFEFHVGDQYYAAAHNLDDDAYNPFQPYRNADEAGLDEDLWWAIDDMRTGLLDIRAEIGWDRFEELLPEVYHQLGVTPPALCEGCASPLEDGLCHNGNCEAAVCSDHPEWTLVGGCPECDPDEYCQACQAEGIASQLDDGRCRSCDDPVDLEGVTDPVEREAIYAQFRREVQAFEDLSLDVGDGVRKLRQLRDALAHVAADGFGDDVDADSTIEAAAAAYLERFTPNDEQLRQALDLVEADGFGDDVDADSTIETAAAAYLEHSLANIDARDHAETLPGSDAAEDISDKFRD